MISVLVNNIVLSENNSTFSEIAEKLPFEIIIQKVTEANNNILDISFLSNIEKQKYESFKAENSKLRFINAHMILNKKLNYSSVNIGKQYKYKLNEFGKPYLKNCNKKFSISYSDRTFAIAIYDFIIGIDIETVDRNKIPDRLDIFFSEEEIKLIDFDFMNFFLLWTKKEAFVKCLGCGIFNEINTFGLNNKLNYVDESSLPVRPDFNSYSIFSFYVSNLICSVCLPADITKG